MPTSFDTATQPPLHAGPPARRPRRRSCSMAVASSSALRAGSRPRETRQSTIANSSLDEAAQCPGQIERLLDGAPPPRPLAAVRLDALAHLVVAPLRGCDQRDGRSGLGCEAQRVARLAAARPAGDECERHGCPHTPSRRGTYEVMITMISPSCEDSNRPSGAGDLARPGGHRSCGTAPGSHRLRCSPRATRPSSQGSAIIEGGHAYLAGSPRSRTTGRYTSGFAPSISRAQAMAVEDRVDEPARGHAIARAKTASMPAAASASRSPASSR